MKLQIKKVDTETPVNIWLEQEADSTVRIHAGKAGEHFKIAFISDAGRLLAYHIPPEQRIILEKWGFQFENGFIQTRV